MRLARDSGQNAGNALSTVISRYLSWPFCVGSGFATDLNGKRTADFATVIHTQSNYGSAVEPAAIAADRLACVIDVSENIDLEQFRNAYGKIAQAKGLKKNRAAQLGDVPHTTVTLGIVFALDSVLPLEKLAEELDRLNRRTPSAQWPDMVVVLSKGVINYTVQFPGEGPAGDYLPPRKAHPHHSPHLSTLFL